LLQLPQLFVIVNVNLSLFCYIFLRFLITLYFQSNLYFPVTGTAISFVSFNWKLELRKLFSLQMMTNYSVNVMPTDWFIFNIHKLINFIDVTVWKFAFWFGLRYFPIRNRGFGTGIRFLHNFCFIFLNFETDVLVSGSILLWDQFAIVLFNFGAE